ncbi:hypothetical protein ACSLN1_25770, partial [Escherichia coli]
DKIANFWCHPTGKIIMSLAGKKIVLGVSGGIAAYKTPELVRRYYNVRMREESPLLSPEMTREFLQSQLTGEEREIFMVIFLDS